MNMKYVSMQLTTGTTILAEMYIEDSGSDFFRVKNPLRPILVDASSQAITLVAMNPFSDSTDYLISATNVVSVGEMHFEYLNLYIESVDRIERSIISKINNLVNPENKKEEVKVQPTSMMYAGEEIKTVQ